MKVEQKTKTNWVSTHHDVIRQLIWESFEAIVYGFVVTGHLFPVK